MGECKLDIEVDERSPSFQTQRARSQPPGARKSQLWLAPDHPCRLFAQENRPTGRSSDSPPRAFLRNSRTLSRQVAPGRCITASEASCLLPYQRNHDLCAEKSDLLRRTTRNRGLGTGNFLHECCQTVIRGLNGDLATLMQAVPSFREPSFREQQCTGYPVPCAQGCGL